MAPPFDVSLATLIAQGVLYLRDLEEESASDAEPNTSAKNTPFDSAFKSAPPSAPDNSSIFTLPGVLSLMTGIPISESDDSDPATHDESQDPERKQRKFEQKLLQVANLLDDGEFEQAKITSKWLVEQNPGSDIALKLYMLAFNRDFEETQLGDELFWQLQDAWVDEKTAFSNDPILYDDFKLRAYDLLVQMNEIDYLDPQTGKLGFPPVQDQATRIKIVNYLKSREKDEATLEGLEHDVAVLQRYNKYLKRVTNYRQKFASKLPIWVQKHIEETKSYKMLRPVYLESSKDIPADWPINSKKDDHGNIIALGLNDSPLVRVHLDTPELVSEREAAFMVLRQDMLPALTDLSLTHSFSSMRPDLFTTLNGESSQQDLPLVGGSSKLKLPNSHDPTQLSTSSIDDLEMRLNDLEATLDAAKLNEFKQKIDEHEQKQAELSPGYQARQGVKEAQEHLAETAGILKLINHGIASKKAIDKKSFDVIARSLITQTIKTGSRLDGLMKKPVYSRDGSLGAAHRTVKTMLQDLESLSADDAGALQKIQAAYSQLASVQATELKAHMVVNSINVGLVGENPVEGALRAVSETSVMFGGPPITKKDYDTFVKERGPKSRELSAADTIQQVLLWKVQKEHFKQIGAVQTVPEQFNQSVSHMFGMETGLETISSVWGIQDIKSPDQAIELLSKTQEVITAQDRVALRDTISGARSEVIALKTEVRKGVYDPGRPTSMYDLVIDEYNQALSALDKGNYADALRIFLKTKNSFHPGVHADFERFETDKKIKSYIIGTGIVIASAGIASAAAGAIIPGEVAFGSSTGLWLAKTGIMTGVFYPLNTAGHALLLNEVPDYLYKTDWDLAKGLALDAGLNYGMFVFIGAAMGSYGNVAAEKVFRPRAMQKLAKLGIRDLTSAEAKAKMAELIIAQEKNMGTMAKILYKGGEYILEYKAFTDWDRIALSISSAAEHHRNPNIAELERFYSKASFVDRLFVLSGLKIGNTVAHHAFKNVQKQSLKPEAQRLFELQADYEADYIAMKHSNLSAEELPARIAEFRERGVRLAREAMKLKGSLPKKAYDRFAEVLDEFEQFSQAEKANTLPGKFVTSDQASNFNTSAPQVQKLAMAAPKGSPTEELPSKNQLSEKADEIHKNFLKNALEMSKSQEPAMRQAAADMLGKFPNEPHALEKLLEMTNDGNEYVRRAAAVSLGNFPNEPRALEALLKLSTDGNTTVHKRATKSLGNFPNDPRALERLLEMSKDHSLRLEVRMIAALSLGNFPNEPRALERLLEMSKNDAEDLRGAAALSLGKFPKEPRALDRLLEMSKDEGNYPRSTAAMSLGKFPNDPRTLEVLLELTKDGKGAVRAAAARSLGKFPNEPRALEALLEMAKDDDKGVREAAAESLGKLPNKSRALERMLKLTKDDEPSVRIAAAKSLGNFHNQPRALKRTLELTKDGNAAVRVAATESLGKFLHAARALEALLELSKDADADVSKAAAKSLGNFPNEPLATERLLTMAESSEPYVRSAVASSLDAISKHTPPAGSGGKVEGTPASSLEAVLKMARDFDHKNREKAAEELGKFTTETRARNELIRMTKEEHTNAVRQSAARSLGKFKNDPLARKRLLEMAGDDLAYLRHEAAEALGNFINNQDVRKKLTEMKNDPDSGVRYEADKSLEKIAEKEARLQELIAMTTNRWGQITAAELLGKEFPNEPRALDTLIELAKDWDSNVRTAAAQSLGKSCDPHAIKALVEAMSTGDIDDAIQVIVYTAAALGNSTDPRATRTMLELANDRNKRVRVLAARALEISTDPRALEGLLELAKDRVADIRYVSARGLGSSSDPRAREALLELAKDGEKRVRDIAIDSLNRQGRENQAPPPHPAQTLAAKIRSAVSRLRTKARKVVSGFQNRGIHPGKRPDTSGFDFKEYRELKPGEPVDRKNVKYVNGKYLEKVTHQTQAVDNMIVVDPRALDPKHAKTLENTIGVISEMNVGQRDRVGLLIGDGKGGNYMKPSQKRYTTANILKTTMKATQSIGAPKGGLVGLLEQNLLRNQLPRGSRVYLVADFAQEQNLKGVGRIIERFSRRGINVIPVQVEGRVKVPQRVIKLGSKRYKINEDADKTEAAEEAHAKLFEFLRKYNGAAINHKGSAEDRKAITSTATQIAKPVEDMSQVHLEAKFEGEEILEGYQTEPPPGILDRIKQAVDEKNLMDLNYLVETAKMRGWTIVLDWVEAMASRKQDASAVRLKSHDNLKHASADTMKMRHDAFNDQKNSLHPQYGLDAWGPSAIEVDQAFKVAIKLKQKASERKTQETTVKPQESLSAWSRIGHSLMHFFGADKGESAQPPAPIAKNEKESLSGTGAMHEEDPGKDQIWLRLNKNLKGAHSYLALGLYGKFDPAHGTYEEVPGFTAQDIATTGKGETVKGKLANPDHVKDVPVPLGAKIASKKGSSVSFTLSDSQLDPDIMNMTISEFRKQARSRYGKQYDTLTETVPLESMPQDIQALIKGIDGMTVHDAMRTIQRFMVENFEYRQFDDITEKPLHQALQAKAARGELKGPNDFLNFILQTRAGVCQEISEMTMAMLRLAGIPTVKFIGYQTEGKTVDKVSHASAIALLPKKGGGWHAEPVEGSWKYIDPKDASEVKAAKLPFASADGKLLEPSDEKEPGKIDKDKDAKADATAPTPHTQDSSDKPEKPKPVSPTKQLEQRLQTKWDKASAAERQEMSKSFEYYVYLLMYRDAKFGKSDVTELMLDADQYKRFKPGKPKPPSYWLAQIRSLGVTKADLDYFQKILSEKMGSK